MPGRSGLPPPPATGASGQVGAVVEQHAWLRQWLELKPTGALDKFRLQLVGDREAAQDFLLKAELAGVGAQPRRRAPGVRGLSGRLSASATAGEFVSNSEQVILLFPEVFRGPLEARQLRGRVSWEKRADDWEILGENLRLSASGGQAGGELCCGGGFWGAGGRPGSWVAG